MPSNATMVTVVLVGIGVYFSVLLVQGITDYLRFRRMRASAVLTWPARRPAHFALGVGALSLAVAIVNTSQNRPLRDVYGLYATAAYFILVVPFLRRIRVGLYRDGVWADTGFLPYARIGRLAFREGPEIVLLLLQRGAARAFRLVVPAEEYGAVRKVLEEKIRQRVVDVETGILGL